MSRLAPAVFLCCSLAALAAPKKPVTLEALASAKAPTEPGSPVWSPDGKQFVYTEDGKLRLYDPSSGFKRDLLSLGALASAATPAPAAERHPFENRYVHDEEVQWFPSGKQLLLIQGGDLFLFRIDAGGWTQLTATPEPERDPKLSPDGTRVSFRRGHDLYVMELASRKITRLTDDGSPTRLNGELDWVYPEELEISTAYWWSPDSKSIAYLQFDVSREPVYPQADLTGPRAVFEPERYPKAGDPNADVQLGVVPAAGGRTRWMNLGETRDALLARFSWLPDSSAIAVVRLNRIQNHLELVIAEAKTGRARTVLEESDPYWINLREDLRFLNDGKQFLWASERDGFSHLYRYSIDGKLLGRVTRGDWEVSSVACVDEAAGRVYYTSTEASPIERQLYSVKFDGGGKLRLSATAGTHAISMGPKCETHLDSFSSFTSPTRRSIHRNDGAEMRVFTEPDRRILDEYEELPSEIVRVKAADGALLYGYLIKPAGYTPGRKYPVIVEVYGGPHAQMVENRRHGTLNVAQVWAQKGYAVWMLDGRGSWGRGHAWESAVFRNLGAKELEDQKAGVAQLVSMGIADPARVGITGWSYGGFMTLYSLLHAADVFTCGVAGAPVTDWRNYDTIYTERYMGLPSENAKGYDQSAVAQAAGNLKGRLLIAHNFEDDNVLFQNTIRMADALEAADKPFEMMVYTNKTHGLTRGPHHFERLVTDFFDRNLK